MIRIVWRKTARLIPRADVLRDGDPIRSFHSWTGRRAEDRAWKWLVASEGAL